MLRQNSTQRHLLYDPDFTPGFTATVSQQMLNGFGFAVNRALIKVAENEQRIERESFRQQAEVALANAKNAYWDLVAARESVRAAETSLAAAKALETANQKQFEAGTMAPLDVETAQSQAAAGQRDLIIAQHQFAERGIAFEDHVHQGSGRATRLRHHRAHRRVPGPRAGDPAIASRKPPPSRKPTALRFRWRGRRTSRASRMPCRSSATRSPPTSTCSRQ